MGLILSVIEQVCIGTCFLSLNLVLVSVIGLFRNLPAVMRSIRWLVRGCLILAYRLYLPVLQWIRPHVIKYLGVDVLNGYARIVATSILSLIILLAVYLIMRWNFSVFWVGLAILHGILVGLAWNEFKQPDGIRLGERIG